jgi:hypothetical protein
VNEFVLAQPEMEKRRSVSVDPPLRAGIFQGMGSIVRWLFSRNAQRERIVSRAAEHRLDEPARLSLGMVGSRQSSPPFHLASSMKLRRAMVFSTSGLPKITGPNLFAPRFSVSALIIKQFGRLFSA